MVSINFDEASYYWRKNKISIGNGVFRYCCKQTTKKGTICRNKISKNGFCYLHSKIKKNIIKKKY